MGTLYTVDDGGNLSVTGSIAGTIAQSQVTGLSSSLSGKVDTSVTLTAAGRLTGGGDLAANRTFTQNIYDTYSQLISESTTARTLVISDAQSIISCTNSSGTTTITIPTNASAAIPIGAACRVKNATGSQLVNLVVAGGVTLLPQASISGSATAISVSIGDGGEFEFKKDTTNTWTVTRLYEQITQTWTFGTGVLSAPLSITFNATRDMNNVRINLPAINGTTSGAGVITSTSRLPARFQPIQQALMPTSKKNLGSTQSTFGLITISTAGAITGALDGTGAFFSSGSVAGLNESQINYNLI